MALTSPSTQPEHPEFPPIRSLDLEEVELLYDVDLDELTVLFYGRQRRHTLRELRDHAYALVDPKTGAIVGVEFHKFMKRFVPHDPTLGGIVSMATILSDEASETTACTRSQSADTFDRLYGHWKKIATPRRFELREMLSALMDLGTADMAPRP